MDTVKVEQLLFGYKNGHKLLASSLCDRLAQQKEVEILSDSSGNGKFESYITCFPLIADGYYVFAKTWYADEMERPGCVWTHVLLIKYEDLELIQGNIDIDALFHRPKEGISYEEYKKSIDTAIDTADIACSLYVIYSLFYSENKALVETAKREEYEKTLLYILPKLPSETLKTLSVCTYSAQNRYFNNEVFSYQITNEGNAKKLSWDMKDYIIYQKKDSIENYPLWVKYIATMFSTNKQQTLYHYCALYDCYTREFMKDFSKLLYATKEFVEPYNLCDFIKLTKKLDDGEHIKTRTLELLFFQNNEEIYHCYDDSSINEELLSVMQDLDGLFVKKKLELSIAKKHAKKLYKERDKKKIQTALLKYIHNQLSENGKSIVAELIKLLQPADLKYFFDMDAHICSVLITSDARFLLCTDIWKQGRDYQLEMLNCARNKHTLSTDSILKCMIENTKENIRDEVYEIFKQKYVDFIYEYCRNGYLKTDAQMRLWGPHLSLDRVKCIELLPGITSGVLLVEIMKSTNSYQISMNQEIDAWLQAVDRNFNYITTNYRYEAALFLLPLVLRSNNASDRIVKLVYEDIYKRLETSTMDYMDWKKMECLLPEVDVQQSWDKCLRLRLAFWK